METIADQLRAAGLLDESGAARFCRTGHFAYESGDHGDLALALDLLFADPKRMHAAAARLAARLRPHAPEVVCGPLIGGALLGQWVAHELDAAFVIADREVRSGGEEARYVIPRVLHSALHGARAVVVDDAVNMGAATLACVREVERLGGRVVAVGSLLLRIPGTLPLWAERGIAAEYLVGLPWNVWSAADCPLCRASVPIEPLA